MSTDLIKTLTDPNVVVAILVSLAVLATFYSLIVPLFDRGDLGKRMKSVATEREQIRARERARLATEVQNGRASLRGQNNASIRQVVERLNLRSALVDDNTVNRLKMAGFRSQNALNTFLFARFCLPFLFLIVALVYIFVLGNFADKPLMVRLFFAIGFAYVGFTRRISWWPTPSPSARHRYVGPGRMRWISC
jgi:tight adherence protein C